MQETAGLQMIHDRTYIGLLGNIRNFSFLKYDVKFVFEWYIHMHLHRLTCLLILLLVMRLKIRITNFVFCFFVQFFFWCVPL